MRWLAGATVCGITLTGALAAAQHAGAYPAHWWTPVPEDQKAVWEIMPQAAKPGEVVLSKRNELGILSNFARTPFTFHGKRYASVEGFWQTMLYPEGPHDPRAEAPGIKWAHTREVVCHYRPVKPSSRAQSGATSFRVFMDSPQTRRGGGSALDKKITRAPYLNRSDRIDGV